ncbi:MAG TPA: dienelactone hydrolase family protein [Burkholderiales bacterium]|nr:dienelactone hydrolase family protein [Burkholderiales bacterium]
MAQPRIAARIVAAARPGCRWRAWRALAASLALAAWAAASAAAGYETRWVAFPALEPFEGRAVELEALMFRPRGAGPFPALVLLHGCGGFYTREGYVTASYRDWLERLAAAGYVALLVDSFNPRGYRSICELQKRPILVHRERVADAYAAAAWLAREPYVAPDRIGLIGWSNGASGTLYGLRPENQRQPGFRAGVAFYPGCGALARSETPYRPYAPLLVLAGEADDWTPVAPCVALTAIAKEQGAAMQIVTYPGAHHSFDRIDLPVRFRPEVRNPNRPEGRGATVGGHPEARADALERVFEFLARHLKH